MFVINKPDAQLRSQIHGIGENIIPIIYMRNTAFSSVLVLPARRDVRYIEGASMTVWHARLDERPCGVSKKHTSQLRRRFLLGNFDNTAFTHCSVSRSLRQVAIRTVSLCFLPRIEVVTPLGICLCPRQREIAV